MKSYHRFAKDREKFVLEFAQRWKLSEMENAFPPMWTQKFSDCPDDISFFRSTPASVSFFYNRAHHARSMTMQNGCYSCIWEYVPSKWVHAWNSCPRIWLQYLPPWLEETWQLALSFSSVTPDEAASCPMPPQDNEHHAAQLQLSDVIYAHSDKSFLQFMKKVLESEDRPPLCTRLPGAVPARPGSKGPILAEKNIPLGWGPRLLLFHCVRARRADLLRVLASPPPWLQDPARLPQQGAVGPAGLEPPWLRFLLDEGGLQVLLDADGDAGAGAGGAGASEI